LNVDDIPPGISRTAELVSSTSLARANKNTTIIAPYKNPLG